MMTRVGVGLGNMAPEAECFTHSWSHLPSQTAKNVILTFHQPCWLLLSQPRQVHRSDGHIFTHQHPLDIFAETHFLHCPTTHPQLLLLVESVITPMRWSTFWGWGSNLTYVCLSWASHKVSAPPPPTPTGHSLPCFKRSEESFKYFYYGNFLTHTKKKTKKICKQQTERFDGPLSTIFGSYQYFVSFVPSVYPFCFCLR